MPHEHRPRRVRRAAPLVAAVMVASLVPACILSIGPLPSAAGEPDAGGGDAADAGGEIGPDAVGEAGPEVGGDSGGPFCLSLSPQPLVCADFDESADAASGWTRVSTTNGAVTLDSAAFRS